LKAGDFYTNPMGNNFLGKISEPQPLLKFLFVAWEGLAGDLAWQLKKEGHQVKYYIKKKSDADCYNGFFEKIDNWRKWVDWADIVCYDKETEVLTKEGWKFFEDINYKDEIATLNSKSFKLEYHRPLKKIKYKYIGKMIYYKSPEHEFCVTPDHKMFVKDYKGRYGFIKAEKIFKNTRKHIKLNCNWRGKSLKEIKIPDYVVKWRAGRPKLERIYIYKGFLIKLEHLLAIASFYLSEGAVIRRWVNLNGIRFYQNYGRILENFKKILQRANISYCLTKKERGEEIRIYNGALANFLVNNFGEGTFKKHIPFWVKELNRNSLKILIEWLMNGDGHRGKFHSYYHSVSKQLLDDFQEILLKIGIAGRTRGSVLSIIKYCEPRLKRKQYWKKINYNDYVYCVRVPNHIIYVRRNGKPMWCGNCFDDVGWGQIAEELRKKGKAVIGGSIYTDKLENDREFGQSELKKYGINILPSSNFSNYDEVIEFIKNNPARYVFKPSGYMSRGTHGIMYLGEEEDGKDILALLIQNKEILQKKVPTFQLQKFVSGVEIAVGAFFNGKEFIFPICINFEHKRLFPGDLGPFTGEMGTAMYYAQTNPIFESTLAKMKPALVESGYHGYIDLNCIVNSRGIYPLEWTCFSDDTEILTEKGWKLIKDVNVNEVVATLNPNTHYLEYQKTTGKIAKRYQGEMVSIVGVGKVQEGGIDCLMTPDHQMYIQKRNGKFAFVRADSIPQGSKIKRGCQWHGKLLKTYTVPGYTEKHYLGRYHKINPIEHRAVTMPMDVWLKFLGIFLAEGSIGGRKHLVTISQLTKNKQIKELLKNFPFRVTLTKKGFQISSTQLVKHLLSYNFGRCNTKYTPDYAKALPPKQIKVFLDAYRIGDGSVHKRTKQVSYFSTSKRLIDDIQELLLKCGYTANIRRIKSKGSRCPGTKYFRNYDLYSISERRKEIDYYVDKRNIKKALYNGKVYCVEVPNHIIYVRRNGKAFWAGNCRFGFPTIQIQLEGILTPVGEWLSKLARGENFELKVKKGFQIGARILVPTYLNKSELEIETYRDLPILFKKPDLNGIHIEDVKIVDGVWRIAGTSGCILVITGSGATIEETRRQVYLRIKNIMIQNMFYRVDIGKRWEQDSDKLMTWGYL